MKVLQINTVCGYGSTGGICVDLATYLVDNGHECKIAYGQGTTTYKSAYKIGTKFENHLHNLLSRIVGKQGYFTHNGTKNLIKEIIAYRPDIIHLHNLHGNYLNFKLLFNFLNEYNMPVVWTLHDCWAYTGKCAHYTEVQCYKWIIECNNCPQVRKYPSSIFFDRSNSSYVDKKNYFTSPRKMTIVPVSNWLASEVNKSFLNKYPIKPIYNWVDHNTFKATQENGRDSYGLRENDFLVLVVSASWTEEDAKYRDLVKLSRLITLGTVIIMVGKLIGITKLPANVIHIPYVQNKLKMAEIYAMANVYVHLSVEDTFGKVIAEALSCGTPAIVYNSTAYPEIVGPGCGFVVEKGDVLQVSLAIVKVQIAGKKSFSIKCREFVVKNFDSDQKLLETLNLYNQMILS